MRRLMPVYLLVAVLCALSTCWFLRPDYPWLPEEVALLRDALPPDLPVMVLVEATPGCYGSCTAEDSDADGRDDIYLIRITPGHEDAVARDTLYHEWAHILSWNETEEHGDAWGVAYARVYRAMEER